MQNNIFIGRKKELKLLEELYNSQKFEMLILRGRIKVGKSYLLNHFSKKYQNNTVFFTADKSAEKSNVKSFCEELNNVLKFGTFLNSFETWKDVFSFFKDIELKQRLVIIIDEFTYLHSSNPAFDSILQNAIDRVLKQKNIFLILCGSEVSTIEDIIDDSTKPLYGRKTAELKLEPFSYLEAKEFFPKYSNEEALTVYSILGGTPLYLSLFDDSLSIRENIIKNCLSTTGYLFNEVENLLRMELKETSFYKNIMLAINSGASNLNTIRDKVGEDSAKISKYISVLINLGYIKKEIPCGEKDRIRNTLYSISDNYFAFYFAFIFKHRNILNGFISPEIFYEKEITNEKLNAFIGKRFEDICKAYLKQQFYLGKMPFYPQEIGRWWGNNPILKKQEEIDILALDDENAIICECKYNNEKFDLKQLKDLEQSALCINKENKSFIIFSKSGVTTKVEELIIDDSNYKVLTIEDLYR
ncbi:ATP-binding protein [Bullifex porci]|uniref:ATP-binding protein n=1 Tax=Bullifex porci TaxID=2606638 RepID=UPI0023F22641|nr:ATP-binding protein [Bullifex porci]MDD7256009.1 ATP-binding protein [Bullifex porci]MDY2742045.1 ATP-binding protein [Bullifex porci]